MLRLACAFLCLIPLFAAGPAAVADEPSLEVRVTAADPASGGRLAAHGALYLRLSYRSEVPLRFQAKGYLGKTEVKQGAAYNPAPVYPAGEHEALVWIAYFGAAQIDEVRIGVFGADWQPVRSLSYPATAEWRPGLPPRDRAAWATQLSERQQAMASTVLAEADGSDGITAFLMALAIVSIPGYVCLQIFMLFQYSGGWRVAAGFPLLGTIPLAIYTLVALAMGSNLWPLMMLFLAPPAFLYLVGLLIVRLLSRILAPS